MANPLKLTPEDYEKIDTAVNLQGAEVYAVTVHKHRGKYKRAIHVFERMPNEWEMQSFENTSTKVKFRGKDAEVKSSMVLASRTLYDTLITRAYDVPYGPRILGAEPGKPLTAEEAKKFVDVLAKREAMKELCGQVWASSNFDDDEEEQADEEKAEKAKEGKGPKPGPKPVEGGPSAG